MSGTGFSPNTFKFTSTFAGIPVEVQYEVEVSEDHRGAAADVIPTVCVIDGRKVRLCEDAGLFHPKQLATRLAEAESHHQNIGGDDFDAPELYPWAGLDYFAARADDRFIAERDHVHYARAGL